MPNKSLGQHWLTDRSLLAEIVDSAPLTPTDTVLEIGPGLGTLTSVLLNRVDQVVAVEYDAALAQKLPGQFPGKKLTVVQGDFLTFDLTSLPVGYKVVANVPYYITTKILQRLLRSSSPPEAGAVLVQHEVAEKLTAAKGKFSVLAVELQLDYVVQLGPRVSKMYFTPPPKVDSQVIVFKKRHVTENAQFNKPLFMRLVQAGFSSPRKKLKTNLSAGLQVDKALVSQWLQQAALAEDCRAEDVSIADWKKLTNICPQDRLMGQKKIGPFSS